MDFWTTLHLSLEQSATNNSTISTIYPPVLCRRGTAVADMSTASPTDGRTIFLLGGEATSGEAQPLPESLKQNLNRTTVRLHYLRKNQRSMVSIRSLTPVRGGELQTPGIEPPPGEPDNQAPRMTLPKKALVAKPEMNRLACATQVAEKGPS